MSYRYKLDSSSKKHRCPACNNLRFVRYLDEVTATFAAEQYGRCDRESKCGYHSAPPLETLCYFVPIYTIKEISAKAYKIQQGKIEKILPKKVIFEQLATGVFIAAYFLQDSKYNCDLKYNENEQKYFEAKGNGTAVQIPVKKVEVQQPVYFDFSTFKSTLRGYEQNTFIQNLLHRVTFPLDSADVVKVIELYRLGTVTTGY
uniref:PG0870-related protein n=1 Tax=Epilithonimonas sp. TaxID=2894511 RepID=UPI0028B0AAA9